MLSVSTFGIAGYGLIFYFGIYINSFFFAFLRFKGLTPESYKLEWVLNLLIKPVCVLFIIVLVIFLSFLATSSYIFSNFSVSLRACGYMADTKTVLFDNFSFSKPLFSFFIFSARLYLPESPIFIRSRIFGGF